jgi:hypothetical protein
MHRTKLTLLVIIALSVIGSIGCSNGESAKNASAANDAAQAQAAPAATPSNKFTSDDVAKLKWIEGTWRGLDGKKPFYERYTIDGNSLVIENLKEDGSPDGEPGRFELKNGEFGKGEGENRAAASEIGADFVQFVPAVPGRRNNFRFVKQPHGWDAILEWPATADQPPRSKIYKMEPWQPKK